jgi:glucose/arabinose dehydrogenase
MRRGWGLLAVVALAASGRPAVATLGTAGFRAIGVAHASYPISAVAVAPDGRLFAAVQALGSSADPDPGTAEIRVYQTYAANDGSVLDEGTVWATVDGVRATTSEEGLLGIALAPDFATSRLVYVYLTTTDDAVNQQLRVYRENAAGTGDLLGTVMTGLEPPAESAARNGGALAFGVDGCLYLGVGDNGGSQRWNAQVLVGTNAITGSETTAFCSSVCLGPTEYPDRTVAQSDGAPNHAGKLLRLAVEGASTAQSGDAAPLAAQPFVYSAGFRNPVGAVVHPLTGQLFVGERGDTSIAQVRLAARGANQGWPCLEGVQPAGNAGCLTGHTADEVLAFHPSWRRPLVAHPGSPAVTPAGLAVYTGLAYPAEFYGDVFYVLRESARIYRLDLQPPCFLPDPAGVPPLAFHDQSNDGDFVVNAAWDGDGDFYDRSFSSLVAVAQGPDGLGRQVLYVAGRQSASDLTADSVVFRIEYATDAVPWDGPVGRVPDTCFAGTGFENPFLAPTCLPPGGPCPGQPDGTPCGDGDVCSGPEACTGGICRHGVPPDDGTACPGSDACHTSWSCQALHCAPGGVAPDGTPCPDGDPCNGLETCVAGTCQPGDGPQPLAVKSLVLKRSGGLVLTASVTPAAPLAPATDDAVALEVADAGGVVAGATVDHPASDPFWKRKGAGVRYANRRASGLTAARFTPKRSGAVAVDLRGKRLVVTGLDDAAVASRLVVGDQCFAAQLGAGCTLDARRLRCR